MYMYLFPNKITTFEVSLECLVQIKGAHVALKDGMCHIRRQMRPIQRAVSDALLQLAEPPREQHLDTRSACLSCLPIPYCVSCLLNPKPSALNPQP